MTSRKDERFPVNQRAVLHDPRHDVHLQLFVRDISAGGLFVTTDHRFERGAEVEVEIPLAAGERLLLPGTVVHAISREQAAQWGRPFGLGVQYRALDPVQNGQLESFLRQVQQKLEDELRPAPFETGLLVQIERGHRIGDLYAVLGLEPTADGDQIRDALQSRVDVMNELLAQEGMTEPLRKRVIAARLSVQRAAALLGDERKRAGYLFRNQLLAPEALAQHLLALPATWDDVAQLWDASYADQATAGRALADRARQALDAGEPAAAVELARAALAQHPFLFALRQQLAQWRMAGATGGERTS